MRVVCELLFHRMRMVGASGRASGFGLLRGPSRFCEWSVRVVFASGSACRASGLGISCEWFRHAVRVVFASGVFLETCR